MIYVGIDPGASGGMAWISPVGVQAIPFRDKDRIYEFWETLNEDRRQTRIVIEQVHAMPAQGVSSTFTFGQNFGWWLGYLDAWGRHYDMVPPQRWQKALNCMTGGDKNISKGMAVKICSQHIGQHIRVTHTIADAICLAEYARRTA